MVTFSILRHLLNDDESLACFGENRLPDFQDVQRWLFLRERNSNPFLPDHHYRLLQEKAFKDIVDLSNLLGKGIGDISVSFLKLDGKRIVVDMNQQNHWQELLTYMPPLVLQSAFLAIKLPLKENSVSECRKYYQNYLLPNFRYTAIAGPEEYELSNFKNSCQGFHDLHVHLSGSTETDNVWQDHLAWPDKIHDELIEGYRHKKVKEQLDQESRFLDPLSFKNKLVTARRIRQLIHDMLFDISSQSYTNINVILDGLNDPFSTTFPSTATHPFLKLSDGIREDEFLLCSEALMYVMVICQLNRMQNPLLATLFHYYLLILGLSNRLLVQQVHQNGFEQFQKNTLNGLREFTERTYHNRFLQMQGNDLNNLGLIEGRFSPKDSLRKNLTILQGIEVGWSHHLDILKERELSMPGFRRHSSMPELRLIAHFIKQEEGFNIDTYIRHRSLRLSIWAKALVLHKMKGMGGPLDKALVGIDAASSEFDANPEVFSPIFRLLRRNGFEHFTFHAGEDFHHIIGGLRAIYEAIDFNGLKERDRIGHATAAGLSALQWLNAVGEDLLIRKGEWLDDLVFVHYLIKEYALVRLEGKLDNIENKIKQISKDIYGGEVASDRLVEAWKARKYCPFLLFSANENEARDTDVFDIDEWRDISNAAISAEIRALVTHYHHSDNRKRYDEIIEISVLEIFDEATIVALQLTVLKIMTQRRIVIETLPTSNVRIGHHRDFSTYHLWNWLDWKNGMKEIPEIIIGTDDTGIFATNIHNEYANIYCHLVRSPSTTGDPIASITAFHKAALDYRFGS